MAASIRFDLLIKIKRAIDPNPVPLLPVTQRIISLLYNDRILILITTLLCAIFTWFESTLLKLSSSYLFFSVDFTYHLGEIIAIFTVEFFNTRKTRIFRTMAA